MKQNKIDKKNTIKEENREFNKLLGRTFIIVAVVIIAKLIAAYYARYVNAGEFEKETYTMCSTTELNNYLDCNCAKQIAKAGFYETVDLFENSSKVMTKERISQIAKFVIKYCEKGTTNNMKQKETEFLSEYRRSLGK